MKLKTYLAEEEIEVKEFAEKINYSRGHLSSVMNGKLNPGKKFIQAVAKETNGLVSAKDFIKKK
jgi:transcriptional regulator with XRE-family HTH domain